MTPPIETVGAKAAKKPRFTDADGARRWLKTLPATSLLSVYDALMGQLAALSATDIQPRDRARIAEVLREQVAWLHSVLDRRYAGRPQPLQEREQEAASQAIELWQALRGQYSICVAQLAEGDQSLADVKAKVLQRALHASKQLVLIHGLARQLPPPALWQQLHSVYATAETLGCAGTAVSDPLMPRGIGTSCYSTYSHALLLGLADMYALHVKEIELVDRWLEMWARKIYPYREPREEEGGGSLLVVDLASSQGLMWAAAAPAQPPPSIRFAHNGRLATSIRERLKRLRMGAPPAELQLGPDCSAEQSMLLLLHLDWAWCRPPRKLETEPSTLLRLCAGGVLAAFYRLGGRALDRQNPLRPLGFRATAQLASIDALSEYDRNKEQIEREWPWEHWKGNGKVYEAHLVRTGSVRHRWGLYNLAIVNDGEHERIGFVTRTVRPAEKELEMTVRLWTGTPKPLGMRPISISVADQQARLPALLQPATADDKPCLILPSRTFAPNRMLRSGDGRSERRFRLVRIVQRGVDFERVAFEETN